MDRNRDLDIWRRYFRAASGLYIPPPPRAERTTHPAPVTRKGKTARAGPERLTTIEQTLAPITGLGARIDPHLAAVILTTPAPRWPPRFSCLWEPLPGGPVYDMVAETASIAQCSGDRQLDDLRSITLRVEGSKDRRSNDWAGFRVRFSGKALHRRALVLADLPGFNINAFGPFGDDKAWGVLDVRDVDMFHDDVATAHGHLHWGVAPSTYQTVQDGPKSPTKGDLKIIERGGTLLTRMPTTMTARGKPGSGSPKDERQTHARLRLIDAGQKLDAQRKTLGRRELMAPLAVKSVDAVAEILRVAGWDLHDLRKVLNSTHAGRITWPYR